MIQNWLAELFSELRRFTKVLAKQLTVQLLLLKYTVKSHFEEEGGSKK